MEYHGDTIKNWVKKDNNYMITGWWLTYPSEKYESQLGWLFPIYEKMKNVPNHQPYMINICQILKRMAFPIPPSHLKKT